jgi:hypothetical protein
MPRHSTARAHTACSGCTQCSQRWTATEQRRRPTPPENRGRRGQPLIPQIPGLAEWLEAEFEKVPRASFKEIEERLKKTPFWPKIRAAGFRTGKTSIHTHWIRWNAERAQKQTLADQTAALSAAIGGEDVLATEATITALANASLLNALENELHEEPGVSAKAASLIDLHRKLQTSSARREAERRAAGIGARRAYAQARAEIVAVLKDQPEALDLVLAAIDNAEASTEKK